MSKKKGKKTKKNKQAPPTFSLLAVGFFVKSAYLQLKAAKKMVALSVVVHVVVGIFFYYSSQSSAVAQTFLTILTILFSMSYIYTFRNLENQDSKPTVRGGLYFGTAQFVPFTLLTVLLSISLFPFAVGAFLYQVSLAASIAITVFEKAVMAGVWILLSVPSVYLAVIITMALMVVALPGAYPAQALKAAYKLGKGKVIRLGALLLGAALILTLTGFLLSAAAVLAGNTALLEITPILLAAILLPAFWSYWFCVYKEQLNT